jgi:pSer/pThr/pTyr-binding forkhead associated (FHA) protein
MRGLYRDLGVYRPVRTGLQPAPIMGYSAAAMARLRVVSGPLAGQTVDVEEEVVIGREDTDLIIDDEELSRRHAVVRRFNNRLQVEDLGSTNGTFVDGARIAEPTLLGGGAEIKLGATVLVVEGVLPVASGESITAARNVTRISPTLSENSVGAPAAAAAAPTTASAPLAPLAPPNAPVTGPGTAPTSQPLTEFHPPERRRVQRGLASRSWVPVALSFGTVIIVAIALVIYFSQHT